MFQQLNQSWKEHLEKEIKKPYFTELQSFVITEYETKTCYPPVKDIFAAFNYFLFNETKVVILGQDPYHGPNQANGLCFSVNDGIKYPPSLQNIFKELHNDTGAEYPKSGNLEQWAKQGVLLLNATLTVRAHTAGSHQNKGWETFTDSVIKTISDKKEDVVFLLWGGYAKKKIKLIDSSKHHVLTSGHPSPLSANRGYWFGNRHFSSVNEILRNTKQKPVKW
ncbi:uracil-DNA glycosylase [Aurantibacter sp.]|uniref:uracil-DNA glycosylase n=1 Tax=Aurantibacter sp. TaxID=2807103 RepID=UPI003267868D